MPAGGLQAAAGLARRSDRMKYPEFWLQYLGAHADPRTRALHYLGTAGALACIAGAVAMRDWRWLVAAPIMVWPGLGCPRGVRTQPAGNFFPSDLVADKRFSHARAVPRRPAGRRAAPGPVLRGKQCRPSR